MRIPASCVKAAPTSPFFQHATCTQCGEGFTCSPFAGYDRCSQHASTPSDDAIDRAVHASKVNDPWNQAGADRATANEVTLRAAAGLIA